jgi:hypothetical protein
MRKGEVLTPTRRVEGVLLAHAIGNNDWATHGVLCCCANPTLAPRFSNSGLGEVSEAALGAPEIVDGDDEQDRRTGR